MVTFYGTFSKYGRDELDLRPIPRRVSRVAVTFGVAMFLQKESITFGYSRCRYPGEIVLEDWGRVRADLLMQMN
jgi:hypothetical protein